MLTEWYLKIDGTERGPVTIDELRSLAASGELAPADLVRSEDDLTWVRADCIAEIAAHLPASEMETNDSHASNENLETGELAADESDWCSLELQSTDTKASIRWTTPTTTTPGTATVVTAKSTSGQHAIVRVPHRTLKVGHGATPAGRAEKQAHQSTVANRLDVEADTVVSENLPDPSDGTANPSAEHGL